MLHIVLTILKITGILLLVVILLVICVTAAVLFVPLRYRLTAVYTGEDRYGDARVTWLLHLISVQIVLRPPPAEDTSSPQQALQISFRIFGISPQQAAAFLKNRKKRFAKKQMAEPAKKQKAEPAKKQKAEPAKKQTAESAEKEYRKEENNFSAAQSGRIRTERQQTDSAQKKSGKDQNPELSKTDKSGKIFERVLNKIRRICDTIKKIPVRFRRLKNTVIKTVKKPGELAQKLSDLRQKLKRYDALETASETWKQVRRMLRHFRVRKGKGYLRFGTGDPALTGELTGVLYLVLPVSCREISVEPQFTDTMLETELNVKGYIRLIHLAAAALWAFRNRKLRRLIRAFRPDL